MFSQPTKMSEVSKKLKAQAVENYASSITITDDTSNLNKLIQIIKEVDESTLEELAKLLGGIEVEMLCAYMPRNNIEFDVEKAFYIILSRLTVRRFGVLYKSWQENYQKHICDPLLLEIASQARYSQLLNSYGLTGELLKKFATSNEVEKLLVSQIKDTKLQFDVGLQRMSIDPESLLAKKAALIFD